ncbi:GNAT family N-acetyltransferase [marine bacterium AO1-C]|nr:GNAT family N-acetyltransferase [marine bacterium AO1-C]
MSTTAIIRFASPLDMDALIQLCAEHAAYEKADYDPYGKKEALSMRLFSPPPPLYCLVVEQHEEIIGYATYMKQFSTWDAGYYLYLDCLYLNEKSRGQGLGEQLMQRIKEEAQKLGLSEIQWQTPDFNEGAIRFYHRLGATSKNKERFFWQVG